MNTVAGVLRMLFGFRFVTAGMLDHRRIAFKSAAATHGISRKSKALAATQCIAMRMCPDRWGSAVETIMSTGNNSDPKSHWTRNGGRINVANILAPPQKGWEGAGRSLPSRRYDCLN